MKPYPKLMYSKKTNRIFYMTNFRVGTVVVDTKPYKRNTEGYFSKSWDQENFEDFEGTINGVPYPELRYIFDGEKEIISIQNDNKPISNDDVIFEL